MVERTLHRYKLLEEVGQGGMAVVYKGFDTTLNREVAVKVLHPHLAGVAESRARLQREAHAVAKLRHENILEIFDYSGPDSPESFIVTEFIHGKTLKNFLTDHPLPFPEVAQMIASEVARALEHAHGLGVIHRDIKPENVMIRDDGMVKLMDFGIAQIVDKERMTVTGQLLGSPAYMAPEHVEGKPLDFRTDVFAVGILTYQLATGALPFRGRNPHEVLKRIAECKFTPPELVNPMIGARMARLIAKALQREPSHRFPDVTPLRKELLEDLSDAGVEDPRKELAAFFADPKGWEKSFRPKLVQALALRGKQLEVKGRAAAALELWSRALAIDPKSPELRALVDGMAKRRRVSRLALALCGALVLAGAMAFGTSLWLNRRPDEPPMPARIAAPKPLPQPVAQIEPKSSPPPVEPKPVINKAARPAPAPKPAPVVSTVPDRTVKLDVEPQGGLEMTLDGKPLDYIPGREYALTPGPHTFHLESPYAFKEDIVVSAETKGEIKKRLAWKPARLTVKAEPESADILVDEKMSRSGKRLELFFDAKSGGRKEVTIKVSAKGFESQTITKKLSAAESADETVVLKKVAE